MTVDRLEQAVTDEIPKQDYQDGFHPAVTLWRSPALLSSRYRHGAVRISYIHPYIPHSYIHPHERSPSGPRGDA